MKTQRHRRTVITNRYRLWNNKSKANEVWNSFAFDSLRQLLFSNKMFLFNYLFIWRPACLTITGVGPGFQTKISKTNCWLVCSSGDYANTYYNCFQYILYIYNTRLAIFARGILLAAAAAAAAMCCKYLSRKFHPENELMWGINIYERENLPEGEISSEYGFFPLRWHSLSAAACKRVIQIHT